MNYNIYTMIAAGMLIAGLAGCEKENAFSLNEGEGALNCESLGVNYSTLTRAHEDLIPDFTVYVVNATTNDTINKFKYAEKPSLITLPVGTYKVVADYGNNPDAAWEKPYYLGETNTFTIASGEVTTLENTVSCSLSNIRVRVNLDATCLSAVKDAKVTVNVGDKGKLEYDGTTNGKAGYFRYVENSHSITAVLTGTLNGEAISETVSFDDAAGGKSYTANFTANKPDNNNPGGIGTGDGNGDGLTIDSNITVEKTGTDVEVDKPFDEIIEDDMRNK